MSPIPPYEPSSGGGGGPSGIGGKFVYDGSMLGTIVADGVIQPVLETFPNRLEAEIVNPFDVPIWVQGSVDLGQYLIATSGYTGRLATFTRGLNSGNNTVAVPIGQFTGGRDGLAPDATPNSDYPLNAGRNVFGFELAANGSEVVSMSIGLSIADDGTEASFLIVTQERPTIYWEGVKIE